MKNMDESNKLLIYEESHKKLDPIFKKAFLNIDIVKKNTNFMLEEALLKMLFNKEVITQCEYVKSLEELRKLFKKQ
ncbi:hypothetical protein LL037_18575 [Clostridium estertheticum]|uniref:hypothetical protein n=1 Tax=Clostridium estertheticum TaxID=238834 RepID=UPI001C0D6D92|nr:hypothetical protein [Clostridium estertheticum]MBU3200288.1 hypothetical protein [Clostridium estertheticum]WAG64459.1 hypothetical protein LL037_18575 [Clostridium estertheticum]